MSAIHYRDAGEADLTGIDLVYRTSFCDTFAHLYAKADLDAFLAQFTPQAWLAQFRDPRYAFRVAEADGELAGYLKLGPVTLPVEPSRPAIELSQLYLLQPWHGKGIAEELMAWAFAEARRRGAAEMYLSVYTDNHRARRFYERYGFAVQGPYKFMVGKHADEDLIMKLEL